MSASERVGEKGADPKYRIPSPHTPSNKCTLLSGGRIYTYMYSHKLFGRIVVWITARVRNRARVHVLPPHI
eukprot:SAG22_NODE_89_length_21278_cov_16.698758_2_plen_71_part_00